MSRFSSHLITGFALASLIVTSSCAVGPDFKRPAAPAVASYTNTPLPAQTAATSTTGGEAQTFNSRQDVPADWWRLYDSPELDALMDQAIKANPDLKAAQASLRQSRELVLAAYGSLLPAVDLDPQVTRQKFSPAAYGLTGVPSSIFTLYNASINVSYGLDIFGGSRREIESLKAQEDYQRYELQAAYLTLTTNVVASAVQVASLEDQIKATKDIIAIESKQLDVLKSQFEFGAIAKSAVLTQQTALAQAQATLPPLMKQLAQKQDQLAVLTGRFPSELPDQHLTLASLHLPQTLPMTLPSQLVERRPDIRASEELLHSASAQIGVATAAMLPQITLSAGYGSEATRTGTLFSSPAEVWSIGAGLVQPIFHGGTLLHERRADVAAFEKAREQYKSTVLTAFGNVADTLRALEYDADALAASFDAAQAADKALGLSREQYRDGAISYPQLLTAEQAYQQAVVALVQAQAMRYADTAALFQALGGGWWNEKPDIADAALHKEKKHD